MGGSLDKTVGSRVWWHTRGSSKRPALDQGWGSSSKTAPGSPSTGSPAGRAPPHGDGSMYSQAHVRVESVLRLPARASQTCQCAGEKAEVDTEKVLREADGSVKLAWINCKLSLLWPSCWGSREYPLFRGRVECSFVVLFELVCVFGKVPSLASGTSLLSFSLFMGPVFKFHGVGTSLMLRFGLVVVPSDGPFCSRIHAGRSVDWVNRTLRIGPKTFCTRFPRTVCLFWETNASESCETQPTCGTIFQNSHCILVVASSSFVGIVAFLWLFVWFFINLMMRERTLIPSFAAYDLRASRRHTGTSEIMRTSRNPTTVMTANGVLQTREEATDNVTELELLVTVMLLEETHAVLSLGKLHHRTSGQKPQLTKKGQENWSQCIKLRVPLQRKHQLHHHLHHGTKADTPKIQYQKEVEVRVRGYGETCSINQQKPKTKIKMNEAKKYKAIQCMTCRTGCRSSERIWLMKVVL